MLRDGAFSAWRKRAVDVGESRIRPARLGVPKQNDRSHKSERACGVERRQAAPVLTARASHPATLGLSATWKEARTDDWRIPPPFQASPDRSDRSLLSDAAKRSVVGRRLPPEAKETVSSPLHHRKCLELSNRVDHIETILSVRHGRTGPSPRGPNRRGRVLRSGLYAAADAGGVRVIGEAFHVFPNGGVTGVLLLAQSHLSIHTWPELMAANVDLLSYGDVDARRCSMSSTSAWARTARVAPASHGRWDERRANRRRRCVDRRARRGRGRCPRRHPHGRAPRARRGAHRQPRDRVAGAVRERDLQRAAQARDRQSAAPRPAHRTRARLFAAGNSAASSARGLPAAPAAAR